MRLIHLGLGSVGTTVGAVQSNVDKALAYVEEMAAASVTLAVFPEQLVGGYPQEDLVQWGTFVDRQWDHLERFATATERYPLCSVLGVGIAHQGLRYNCAALVGGGRVLGLIPKEKLPNYSVLYEGRTTARGFEGMSERHRGVPFGDFVFDLDFGRIGLEVCEDMWSADGPIRRRTYAGAELIINVSASPFRIGIDATRRELVATRASDHQCTIAYVNQVGAQDGLIFDGGGYVNQNGFPILELPRFKPIWRSAVVDLDRTLRLRTENTTWRDDQRSWAASGHAVRVLNCDGVETARWNLTYPGPKSRSFFLPLETPPIPAREKYCEDLLDALALGLGDYYEKTGKFRTIGIALSGGRDSLLTLLIAHRYAQRSGVSIETFSMPSHVSSPETKSAAATIAAALGVRHTVLSIEEAFHREVDALRAMLENGQSPTPLTLQNIQARLRAQRMWNWANSSGGLFLQTGNMSEKAFGYTTVGGDLMGSLAVIANLPKTVVIYLLEYLLEKHRYAGIAQTLAQPAGPELEEGQKGEEDLMEFPLLDACFYLVAAEKLAASETVEALAPMFPEVSRADLVAHVDRFIRAFSDNVYKWVQSPVSLHVGNLDLDRERALQLPVVTKMEW